MTVQVMAATRFCIVCQVLVITFHLPGVLQGLPQLEENPKKMSCVRGDFSQPHFRVPRLTPAVLTWYFLVYCVQSFARRVKNKERDGRDGNIRVKG